MTLEQQKEAVKRQIVEVVPVTDDIGRPDQLGLSPTLHSWRVDKLPPLNLWTAELISFDEQVKLGLEMRNGPLFSADAVASGPDEQIVQWLQDEWNAIWDSSSAKLLRTKIFGCLGFEVMATEDAAGLVRFKSLKELHPSMCRPLSMHHEVQGIMVRPYGHGNFWTGFYEYGQDDHKKRGKRKLVAPKCLWTTFGSKFENPFGESILHYCYSPWYEKEMEHGAKKLCQQRMIKDSWIGDVFLYPPNVALNIDDGTAEGRKKPWREFFREAAETRLAGGIMTLPLIRDPTTGQPMSDYRPPQAIPGETPLFDWLERLNVEIWKGLGIPREVLEASGTGSGFSGRSIPFIMFVSSLLVEFQQIVRPVLQMVLRPWIALNFGVDPNDYDLKPMAADQLIQKITGGSTMAAMGGAGIGMGGGMGQGMPQQGMPMQMSEDAVSALIDKKLTQRTPLQNMHDALPDVSRTAGVSRQAADMARWLVAGVQCRQFGEEATAKDVLKGAGVRDDVQFAWPIRGEHWGDDLEDLAEATGQVVGGIDVTDSWKALPDNESLKLSTHGVPDTTPLSIPHDLKYPNLMIHVRKNSQVPHGQTRGIDGQRGWYRPKHQGRRGERPGEVGVSIQVHPHTTHEELMELIRGILHHELTHYGQDDQMPFMETRQKELLHSQSPLKSSDAYLNYLTDPDEMDAHLAQALLHSQQTGEPLEAHLGHKLSPDQKAHVRKVWLQRLSEMRKKGARP